MSDSTRPAAPTQTGQQPEGRALREAAETRRLPLLDDAATAGAQRKQVAQLRRALKLADEDTKQALALALKALALDENFAQAQHLAGLLYDKTGQVSRALEHYERAWRLNPEDAEIYQNLGLAAWKLDMLEAAERFFRISLQKEPGRQDAIINLTGVLRDQGRFDDAIEIVRQAIFADQRNPSLWNTLGTVLLEAGDPFQAETFYREALAIQPDLARAWHNLGFALDLQGNSAGAVDAYDRALSDKTLAPDDKAQMRHGRAFSLLACGRLTEGWDEYDIRTQPAYSGATVFAIPAPRWNRDPAALKGKRVLLAGEQGLGDEVLFMNAGADLLRAIGEDGKLLIACTDRLVPLIARAFPQAIVGPHHTFEAEARKFRTAPWIDGAGGCDLWAPMADAVCVFRRSVADFPDTPAFLPADPERVAKMRGHLEALGPGLKVGVIWKSMLMTASRAKYFSPFAQWAPVLKTPGAVFVNLQYGEVTAELAQATRELGITIHEIPGLNVRNDLDGVAALGAALDVSIGPATASTNLTAAAGGETWMLGYRNHWTSLGVEGRLPFYPSVRMICPSGWNRWGEAMAEAAALLAARIEATGSRDIQAA